MSEKKFELQTTSGAFSGRVPDGAWRSAEQFDTLEDAFAAQRGEVAAMRERCGPSAWDSHSRIVALVDTSHGHGFFCDGPISDYRRGWDGGCPDFATEITETPWPAGMQKPRPAQPSIWIDGRCPKCAAEHERRIAIYFSEIEGS